MNPPNFELARQYVLDCLARELSPQLIYHSLAHTRCPNKSWPLLTSRLGQTDYLPRNAYLKHWHHTYSPREFARLFAPSTFET